MRSDSLELGSQEGGRAHKVVDLLAALLVPEAWLAVSRHDALASPLPDPAAEVGLVAPAHYAFPAEGLQMGTRSFSSDGLLEWAKAPVRCADMLFIWQSAVLCQHKVGC